MKRLMILFFVFFCMMAFTTISNNKKTFKKLYGLEGVWKMNIKNGSLCEEWKMVDKYFLQSKGFMIKGKDTMVNERVELKASEGGISYTSRVEDQNNKMPISFTMTSSKDNEFVFENPQHDFPKRIVYHLISADSLHAWIDDGIDGSKKRSDFHYKKQTDTK
ncbi:MAG: DUF6265 family protein [Saprospiraceae bacterium]